MPKVADYPLRTSVSPTDVLYIIGNDDGQITLEQFFRNVNTPFVTTSTVAIGGVAQTRFNSGEINVTTNITKLATDADGVALTIANGLYEGQLKVVLMDQFGGEAVLDGPNLLAPITFGETTAVVLMWVGTVWRNVTGGSGGAGEQGPIGYTGSQGPIGYTGSSGGGSGGNPFEVLRVEFSEILPGDEAPTTGYIERKIENINLPDIGYNNALLAVEEIGDSVEGILVRYENSNNFLTTIYPTYIAMVATNPGISTGYMDFVNNTSSGGIYLFVRDEADNANNAQLNIDVSIGGLSIEMNRIDNGTIAAFSLYHSGGGVWSLDMGSIVGGSASGLNIYLSSGAFSFDVQLEEELSYQWAFGFELTQTGVYYHYTTEANLHFVVENGPTLPPAARYRYAVESDVIGAATRHRLMVSNGTDWQEVTGVTYALENGEATIYDQASTSTATIDWNNGPVQRLTLTQNCVVSFTNAVAGGRYTLIIEQGGAGNFTPTLNGWSFGTNTPGYSTTTGQKDVVMGLYDGTEYLARQLVAGA